MKILHIIGNGFDLNLGLNTRFSDFYKYYLGEESKNESVNLLKKEIGDNIENWSDLEIAFGEFTQKLSSTAEFDDVFEDILTELSKYILSEDEKIRIEDSSKFYSSLAFPELYLPTADKNTVTEFKNKWNNISQEIHIATLNYTKSFEKFIDIGDNIINTPNGKGSFVRSIIHIHGYADDRMILGVNDHSQIGNEEFRENVDVLESILKPICNRVYKHTEDSETESIIRQSNLICIFGSSLGKTDNYWWQLIGNRLTHQETKLIIFVRRSSINPIVQFRFGRIEREIKNQFIERANIDEENIERIKSKIIVAVNTTLFSEVKSY